MTPGPEQPPANDPTAPTPRRVGRRPGGPDTRGAVLAAARAEFAARGYQKASMRGIARVAGVDPALLHHYFGSKDRLFLAVLDFPLDPRTVVEQIVAGDRARVGERIARFVLTLWEDRGVRERLLAVLRGAAGDEEVAAMLRGFVVGELVARIAAGLELPRPELRVELVLSQVIGLAMARYVVAVEPLASATVEELVPLLAPTLQGYLTGG
ncbi:TetR/AcrR family transcriptional regulator [Streptacidiphilus cavernicola]|uniref:TetR family transcriptional regulator n=1 Tax=Streptacidiphilus cavernicola TaxID=3342716 RepID=A0ABV6W591_9ACTN